MRSEFPMSRSERGRTRCTDRSDVRGRDCAGKGGRLRWWGVKVCDGNSGGGGGNSSLSDGDRKRSKEESSGRGISRFEVASGKFRRERVAIRE